MEPKPLISVVMPAFNTEKYVAESIRSVLGQSYTNIELICIDDGSSDGTLKVIRTFVDQVRIVECNENRGIAVARNQGLALATGDFIAFIDADDVWETDKLEKQLRAFKHDPELAMCFTYMRCFLSPELPEEIKSIRYCPTEPAPAYIAGTALLKKEVVERVGLFDESLRIGEFIDWNSRAQEAGFKSAMLEDVMYQRRIHETNTGVNERPSRTDYLKVARNAIARRKLT